jgi:hypothetical protein
MGSVLRQTDESDLRETAHAATRWSAEGGIILLVVSNIQGGLATGGNLSKPKAWQGKSVQPFNWGCYLLDY